MLSACNNMSAEYLFQPDKHYDVRYDTGDKTIQCGRRPDAFKLWLGWKAKVRIVILRQSIQNIIQGKLGFSAHVDKCLEIAEYFEQEIRRRPEAFKPVLSQVRLM